MDRMVQLAYKGAYLLMRTYWKVRKPVTHGALVALWNGGEILLVQNSYVPYRCVPGGYLARGESGRQAAVRELREEVGIDASESDLVAALDEVHHWQGRQDHVQIFHLELSERPVVRVDNREVIGAGWFSPKRALELNLFPPLRRVIEERAAS